MLHTRPPERETIIHQRIRGKRERACSLVSWRTVALQPRAIAAATATDIVPFLLPQRLRILLLQILHRIPHVEALRSHSGALVSLLLYLLRIENEDNAVLCVKVIIDLHRTYSRRIPAPPNADGTPSTNPPTVSAVEASVDEFLDIVADVFKGMGAVVEETFSSGGATPGAMGGGEASAASPSSFSVASEVEGTAGAHKMLALGMKSFKLLTECPSAIVFIFQTYRDLVNKAIDVFVPLVFQVR